jgi:hypothetical protein
MANKLTAAEIAVHDSDDWASEMSRTHLENVQHQGDGIKAQEAGAKARVYIITERENGQTAGTYRTAVHESTCTMG